MRILHQIITWVSSILFLVPLLTYIFVQTQWWINNRTYFRLFSMLCWIISVWLFLMRRVIPYDIVTSYTNIPLWASVNIALISDMHLWMHKNKQFTQKIVDKLNSLTWVDFVLVAGDWTYYPATWSLADLYSPFKQLTIPVYGVLWNHDVQKPGPDLRSELELALEENDIRLLQNEMIETGWLQIVGLGEYMNYENQVELLQKPMYQTWSTWLLKRLVLSHNPDVTLDYASGMIADLTLVWHTHCGQIKLFWLEKYVMPTRRLYQDWYSKVDWRFLFITCWLWEVMLPMRWWAKPSIDIIDLH